MTIGHNSLDGKKLRAFVESIEKLEEEKRSFGDDVKSVYAEVKAGGLDTKTVRAIVRLRRQDKAKRDAEAETLDLYGHAIGLFD